MYYEENTRLVECFGKLEQLCSQIYGEKHGVTSYINDMTAKSSIGWGTVNGWEKYLSTLKEVRHKRNQLSHGEVSFEEWYATEEDIRFIEEFERSILTQTDPLSMLRKKQQEERERQKQRLAEKREAERQKKAGDCTVPTKTTQEETKEDSFALRCFLAAVLLAVFGFALYFLLGK